MYKFLIPVIILSAIASLATTIFVSNKPRTVLIAAVINAIILVFVASYFWLVPTPFTYLFGNIGTAVGIEYDNKMPTDFITISMVFFALLCLIPKLISDFINCHATLSRTHATTTNLFALLSIAGILLFGMSRDLFNLYIFYEIISVSGYIVMIILNEDKRAYRSWQYVFLGAISSIFIVLGIALLYNASISLNFTDVDSYITATTITQGKPNYNIIISMILILSGLGMKAGISLFAETILSVYQYSSKNVMPYIGLLFSKVPTLMMAIFVTGIFGGIFINYPVLKPSIAILVSIFGLIYSLRVFKEKYVYSIMSYAMMISSSSIFVASLYVENSPILAMYFATDIVSKYGIYRILSRLPVITNKMKLSDLYGICKTHRHESRCLIILLLVSCGVLPFGVLIGKLAIAISILKSGHYFAIIGYLLLSSLGIVSCLKIILAVCDISRNSGNVLDMSLSYKKNLFHQVEISFITLLSFSTISIGWVHMLGW